MLVLCQFLHCCVWVQFWQAACNFKHVRDDSTHDTLIVAKDKHAQRDKDTGKVDELLPVQPVHAGRSIGRSHDKGKDLFCSTDSSGRRTRDANVLLPLGSLACRISLLAPSLVGSEAESLFLARGVAWVVVVCGRSKRFVFVGELVYKIARITPKTEIRVGGVRGPATTAALFVEGAGTSTSSGAVSGRRREGVKGDVGRLAGVGRGGNLGGIGVLWLQTPCLGQTGRKDKKEREAVIAALYAEHVLGEKHGCSAVQCGTVQCSAVQCRAEYGAVSYYRT